MLGDDIAKDLMEQIISNKLELDTKLKSERLLAEEYGVSRTVIREALRTLSDQGFLVIMPGKGAYVRHPGSEAITDNLVKLRNLDSYSLSDLLEVRRMLEVTILRQAAERATDQQIDELEQCWQAIEDGATDVESFIRLDNDFHHHLFSLGGNSVMEMLTTSLYDSVDQAWFMPMLMDASRMAASQKEHWEIVAALRSRDADRCEQAILAHLGSIFAKVVEQQTRAEERAMAATSA
ncbi:MAG: FadR family transcriptional regulator [Firmicutes bacterium]|nr:FadR family transcriptional regulator [Bacillota bacterium]